MHSGRAQHAVNLFGGMHHAMADRAAGFCVYNDVGVAIRWLLDRGVQRVAYVDVDAHHGDGVQAMFYDDPRVLTISLHESGRTLFPGTGWPGDIGGPGALGTSVNVALPAGTADNQWLRAFNAVVPAVLEEFDPEFLVSQHGCDSHFEDAMAHLLLSVDGQRTSYSAVHRLAHRLAGGRWVAVGGGRLRGGRRGPAGVDPPDRRGAAPADRPGDRRPPRPSGCSSWTSWAAPPPVA